MEMALNTSVRISNIEHNQNMSSSSWTEIWRWMGCQTWYFVWVQFIHNMQTMHNKKSEHINIWTFESCLYLPQVSNKRLQTVEQEGASQMP